MSKKLTLLISLFCLASFAMAQEESLFNRINGTSFKNNIYIKWGITKSAPDGLFLYRIDAEDEWYPVDEDLIFKVRNNHKNNFKVYVEFYNPLNYSVKSNVKDLDDPSYQAFTEFISKLPTNATTAEDGIPPTPENFVLDKGEDSIKIIQSILLHEWIYEFSTIANITDTNSFKELVTLINTIKDADDYLFNKFIGDISEIGVDQEFTVNGWIKNRTETLYATDNSYTNFNTELGTSIKIKDKLLERKKKAVNALKSIEELLSKNFDSKIAPFIPEINKKDFKINSASTAVWLSLNHNDRFDANEKAIDKFNGFLDKLNKHIAKYPLDVCDSKGKNCNHYIEDYNFSLNWKSTKMKLFEYEIAKYDKEGTEVSNSKSIGSFTVGKKMIFYPFVSSGILYTNFSYPNYSISTDNGINTVAKTADTKVNVRPTVFLNMLITSWDPVYPFIQLGITTGVNDALFPVGFGFSFGSSFSISGGALLGYTKDLSTLDVGKEVKDEATLQNDLTNKGLVKAYFSINYNFGKK